MPELLPAERAEWKQGWANRRLFRPPCESVGYSCPQHMLLPAPRTARTRADASQGRQAGHPAGQAWTPAIGVSGPAPQASSQSNSSTA